jgi:hypothetical protein|tara:strand:- start:17503 stop:17781 length:279 start_codon:yes stop_codon:yes gene_type:complete
MIIISKIELEGTDDLKYTDVGYTTDILVANEINEAYDSSLGKFIGENRTKLQLGEVSISTFFSGVSYVNEARTEVETVDGLGISEITNVNQL